MNGFKVSMKAQKNDKWNKFINLFETMDDDDEETKNEEELSSKKEEIESGFSNGFGIKSSGFSSASGFSLAKNIAPNNDFSSNSNGFASAKISNDNASFTNGFAPSSGFSSAGGSFSKGGFSSANGTTEKPKVAHNFMSMFEDLSDEE